MYGQSTLVYLAENQLSEDIDNGFDLRRTAARNFWRFFAGGFWSRLQSAFGGRRSELLSLKQVTNGKEFEGARSLGTTAVPISQIRGSECKSTDFDREFRPLKAFIRDRWIGIAVARLQGKALPPVELIQVGDDYFVRDGHHRISVARSFGQVDVDAVVTRWNLATGV